MLRWENEDRNIIKGYKSKQADIAWINYQRKQVYQNHT